MQEHKIQSEGYTATKRFLRDYPTWLDVVEACAVEAKRTQGEFAGSWALNEAKKSGRKWFSNLRPLVSYGILKRTDVTRGGRRAYYLMPDIEGVKAALRDVTSVVNEAATAKRKLGLYRGEIWMADDFDGP